MTMLVDGALSQSINPAHWVGLTAHPIQRQSFLPQAFTLAESIAYPHRASVGHPFGSRVLHTRAQRQIQAVAKTTQVHRSRAIAAHAGVSAPHQFFLGTPVHHGKGIQIDRGMATGPEF